MSYRETIVVEKREPGFILRHFPKNIFFRFWENAQYFLRIACKTADLVVY